MTFRDTMPDPHDDVPSERGCTKVVLERLITADNACPEPSKRCPCGGPQIPTKMAAATDADRLLRRLSYSHFKRHGLPKEADAVQQLCRMILATEQDLGRPQRVKAQLMETHRPQLAVNMLALRRFVSRFKGELGLRRRRTSPQQSPGQPDIEITLDRMGSKTFLQDKGGIHITPPSTEVFKLHTRVEDEQAVELVITVLNGRAQDRTLVSWDVLNKPPQLTLHDNAGGQPTALPHNQPVVLRLEFTSGVVQQQWCVLVLNFGTFRIGRHCHISATSTALQQLQAEVIPLERPMSLPDKISIDKSEGQPPAGTATAVKLKIVYPLQPLEKLLAAVRGTLQPNTELMPEMYCQRLHFLWSLEEHQMREDMQRYDMVNEPMEYWNGTPHSGMLELHVPGLAEKRPSVLKGKKPLCQKTAGEGRRKGVGRWLHFSDGKLFPRFCLRAFRGLCAHQGKCSEHDVKRIRPPVRTCRKIIRRRRVCYRREC